MCHHILDASILRAVPSDKHMPGMEPRGDGKTTDAIQTTPSLFCKLSYEDKRKKEEKEQEMH